MNSEEKRLFNLLKKQIIAAYLKNNSSNKNVKKWSGEDIISFQEDLFYKVKTRVSVKWFYNYFKNDPIKLPRIDMLNILSKYINFENWEDFKDKNTTKSSYKLIWVLLPIIILSAFFFLKNTKNTYHFCFYDQDKNEQITVPINIKVLNKQESPLFYKSNKKGCFEHKTKEDIIEFVVSSPYYKADTIKRLANNLNSIIKLVTDDYALMLDYYTNNKTQEWRLRKKELENLINDKAIIYQLYSKNIGVEIYTKKEFINLLTIPTHNLKKIRIVNKEFKNNKIVKLKFIVE